MIENDYMLLSETYKSYSITVERDEYPPAHFAPEGGWIDHEAFGFNVHGPDGTYLGCNWFYSTQDEALEGGRIFVDGLLDPEYNSFKGKSND
jgi:hypothetical protein